MGEEFEGEKSIYGIPNTIGQIESSSALVTQLKNLLENAMDRESNLTDFIEKLCKDHLGSLAKKFETLTHADMRIREDAERLRMRNEELEIRLLGTQEKLWTLKLMYEDYDQILEKFRAQQEENAFISKENRNELIGAIDAFLSSHGIPRKRGNTNVSTNLLSPHHIANLKKKQSVRFQNHPSNSEANDQTPHTFGQRSQNSILRKQS